MQRIKKILSQISTCEIIEDYKNGIYFSEKANKIFNSEHVDCDIVNYYDSYVINFYEEDNEDVLIDSIIVKK